MGDAAFSWVSATTTHPGKVREVNEDASLALPARGLWVVADGMGGHDAGDVASRMIVESLGDVESHEDPADFLDEVEDRLLDVNMNLYETANNSALMRTIGSTVVALLVMGGRHTVIVWAGDSRAYRLRAGELQKLTIDHSQVEVMVQIGELTREEAEEHPLANVITRAVGGTEDLYLDVDLRELADGDRYLLCSDGLYKDLSDEAMARCLGTGDCEAACQALLDEAMQGQANDNITVAVIEFNRKN
ncbi:MAG: protein phosphatase 2C domain-containing protein [Gammaproteobacteria bacterium]|nr:protein phosphatase 2C domain-containing protein [Gammaproteobacteria bacterium]MDH3767390.1 protein phosphatase 2C domain-containing protein [Gammaproteobacteria bacterium]